MRNPFNTEIDTPKDGGVSTGDTKNKGKRPPFWAKMVKNILKNIRNRQRCVSLVTLEGHTGKWGDIIAVDSEIAKEYMQEKVKSLLENLKKLLSEESKELSEKEINSLKLVEKTIKKSRAIELIKIKGFIKKRALLTHKELFKVKEIYND